MYDSIRDVAQQELFNSYRGILRISPNYFDDAEIDDTTNLYNKNDAFYRTNQKTNSPDENQTKIQLSSSSGDLFDIYFYPATFNCKVVGAATASVDLVNIVHYYNILRVNKNINIKSTLSCKQLIAKNNNTALKYPVDCPYNSSYCNAKDGLGIGNDISADNIENKFSDPNLLLKITNYKQVEVDGQLIWRRSTVGSKIPEVYRQDYILGHSIGGTYKNGNISETQLSFVSLDKIIWEKLTAALRGVSANRSYKGRYTQLGEKGNKDIKSIFGSSWNEDEIKKSAPIIGMPVQSGLIMYSAMPLQRYGAHLKGLDLTNDPGDTYVYNLLSEYALCDGKVLKYANGQTDYNNIDKNSKNWKNFAVSDTTKVSTYSKIFESMPDTDGKLHTPALFEVDQISPRYLRGLNWNDKYEINSTAFAKSPNGDNSDDDKGNNSKKDLSAVGPYLNNHDYKVRKITDHKHLCLANENAVPSVANDKLYALTAWSSGHKVNREAITPTFNTEASGYKTTNNKPSSYQGTYILQTRNGEINREWQDIPIAVAGGSRSYTCTVGYTWKDNKLFVNLGKKFCRSKGHQVNKGSYAPGYFHFRGIKTSQTGLKWRTISSTNKHFIVYGKASNSDKPAASDTFSLVNNTKKVDDTLSFPATFNFLPLIKI